MEDKRYLKQSTLFEETESRNPKFVLCELEKRRWRLGKYKKQSWGIWLHSIAPYVGRMKPAFAYWLVRICSRRGDIVLDPFCGIGTVPLEADLHGRLAIGMDVNPYAVIVSKAKFDRRPLKEQIDWLKKIELRTEEVDITEIPHYVRQFYHERTLKELFALKKEIERESRTFLLGCLLGISHGHRPQHLSSVTGYIVPYTHAKYPPSYKPVIPKMIQKVRRMYTNSFPLETNSEIIMADARKIPLKDNTVDVVISSPPYYSTIDYVDSNRLRLAIIGFDEDERISLKQDLIQQESNYLQEMKKVGREVHRVLKPGSLCVFVLGDFPKGNKVINTAKDISELYSELGFVTHGIIEDEIPTSKRSVLKWVGREALKFQRKKLDRILVTQARK